MKVLVFDMNSAESAEFFGSLSKSLNGLDLDKVDAGGCAPPVLVEKSPTQGVVAGLGERFMVLAAPKSEQAVADNLVRQFARAHGVELPAEKPPTQGVTAGLGETSTVMKPSAPPMGVVTMMKLANHPWFQEWVAFIAPAPMVTEAGGDSLKLAQRLLGSVILKGKSIREWDHEQDELLADTVRNYEVWAQKKGYNLDE